MAHTPGHKSDVQGQGVRDFLGGILGGASNFVTNNPVSRGIASAASAGRNELLSDWRLMGDGKPPVQAPTRSTTQAIENAITRVGRAANPAQARSTGTFYGNTGPNSRTALGELDALTSIVQSNQEQAIADLVLRNQAKNAASDFARANAFNTDRFRTGATPGLDASIDFGVAPQQKRTPTSLGQGGPSMTDLASVAFDNPNTGTGTPPPDGKLPPGPPPPGPPPPPPGPPPPPPGVPGDPAVPVSDTIRSLYGELSTRDFSNMIRNMMAERETNLRGLNQQSVDQLAASVLRRTGQIGDIKTALETELGVLDADRAGVQQGLVDAVAARAQQMQADTDASLATARAGLGDQVTDEFEKVAQIVGSQAGSQAMSSQDAMARLAQVANMAAAERLAAPAELASEAELALGDDEFAYTQALQSNLSEALAGLDAEEAERVLGEAMRQENFNIGRDQRMIEALVGDFVRKDTQQFQAGQAQLGRDFSADQAQLGRDFSADQSALSRAFSSQQSALSRAFQQSERVASQNFKTEQAEIVRAANEDAARIKQEASVMATQAEAADEQTAADLYKVDVALWRQMTGTERQALREDWIETQQLAGIGQEAFPMGTMQNLQQKYPKLSPEFFVHVNALLGIDTLNAGEDEAAVKLREEYLEGLRTTDAFGAKGLSVDETSIIDTLYAELAEDVAAVARQNRNLANDSRNMQQRERTGALTR